MNGVNFSETDDFAPAGDYHFFDGTNPSTVLGKTKSCELVDESRGIHFTESPILTHDSIVLSNDNGMKKHDIAFPCVEKISADEVDNCEDVESSRSSVQSFLLDELDVAENEIGRQKISSPFEALLRSPEKSKRSPLVDYEIEKVSAHPLKTNEEIETGMLEVTVSDTDHNLLKSDVDEVQIDEREETAMSGTNVGLPELLDSHRSFKVDLKSTMPATESKTLKFESALHDAKFCSSKKNINRNSDDGDSFVSRGHESVAAQGATGRRVTEKLKAHFVISFDNSLIADEIPDDEKDVKEMDDSHVVDEDTESCGRSVTSHTSKDSSVILEDVTSQRADNEGTNDVTGDTLMEQSSESNEEISDQVVLQTMKYNESVDNGLGAMVSTVKANRKKSPMNDTYSSIKGTVLFDKNCISPAHENIQGPLIRRSSLTRTPKTAAWLAKRNLLFTDDEENHLPSSLLNVHEHSNVTNEHCNQKLRVDKHVTSQKPSIDCTAFREEDNNLVQFITKEKYDAAPRIVKMQVSFEQVNEAAKLLNKWWTSENNVGNEKLRVTEKDANVILAQSFTVRKSKSILCSLCHWKKMMIDIASDGSRSFVCV